MNNENAKKHSSKVLDDILNEITPLEYEKTKNRMLVAAKIYDLISNVFGNKAAFAKHIDKYPSEITKWTSGTQNFTLDALTEITWALGKKLSHLFEEEKETTIIIQVQNISIKSPNIENIYSEPSFNSWGNTPLLCTAYTSGVITPYISNK